MRRGPAWIVMLLALAASGCIKAPDVIIVDRQTALEQQANGRFPSLQEQLDQAAITAEPVPFTRTSPSFGYSNIGINGSAGGSLCSKASGQIGSTPRRKYRPPTNGFLCAFSL